jgi:hypothetical protein
MDKRTFKTAFKTVLKRLDLTIYLQQGNHYILIQGNDSSRIVCTQLICSTKIDPILHGSHNDTEILGIGHFKFFIPKWEDKINFYVFAFPVNEEVEFVCVSDEILRSRFGKRNRIPTTRRKAELTLWLMPDTTLYDCTQISIEGEWYYLSKGIGGRMADGGIIDYSKYLNNWDGIRCSYA